MGTTKSNALLDVPVMIPEHADGLGKSRKIENTAKVKLAVRVAHAYGHASTSARCWQAGKTD